MAINKVVFGSNTLIDLSTDTVTSSDHIMQGHKGHLADGSVVDGTLPNGSATASATKGTVSNHAVTVTPKVTKTAGYISSGTANGTGVSVSASELVSGSQTATENGTFDVTNLASFIVNVASGGGGLPSGIAAVATGYYTVTSDFTGTSQTVTHNLGVVPDFVIFFAVGNIAQTYTEMFAIRSTLMGYRASNYTLFYSYHGSSSTTSLSIGNSGSTTAGVYNLTSTTFKIAPHASNYYWRAGTYRWFAIKFN